MRWALTWNLLAVLRHMLPMLWPSVFTDSQKEVKFLNTFALICPDALRRNYELEVPMCLLKQESSKLTRVIPAWTHWIILLMTVRVTEHLP